MYGPWVRIPAGSQKEKDCLTKVKWSFFLYLLPRSHTHSEVFFFSGASVRIECGAFEKLKFNFKVLYAIYGITNDYKLSTNNNNYRLSLII